MNEKKRDLIIIFTILFFMVYIIYYIPVRYSRDVIIDEEPLITTIPEFETSFNTQLTPISLSKKDDSIKLILINLAKRKDRLGNFINSFTQSDLLNNSDLYRFEAVYGKNHLNELLQLLSENALREFKIYKRFKKRIGHHSLTEGGMGCYMSHVLVWDRVKKNNIPCIIAEDDVIIPQDTYSKLSNVVKKIEIIPKKRPYIILFHSLCSNLIWDKLECVPISNGVYNAKQFWSMAFYYMTPEAADLLLKHVFPIKYQIDHLLSLMNKEGLIDIFYVENVVNTSFSSTDIQVPLL